jgi:L-serine dehydratase, iron-sulfur-dependent, beta subunit
MNLFDIIGPIMVGPSSSHTAGAVRLGLLARKVLGEQPVEANIDLYGSFAQTYKGHGTDLGLIAGLLGWSPDDERLPDSFTFAQQEGLKFTFNCQQTSEFIHPNTAHFQLTGASGFTCSVGGASVGGGSVIVNNIDGFPVELTGKFTTLLTVHEDKSGVVALVSGILTELCINIASMKVFRRQKGGLATMIIEIDQDIDSKIIPIIGSKSAIKSVRLINRVS